MEKKWVKTDRRGPCPPEVGIVQVSPAHFEAADKAAVATWFCGAATSLV